MLDMQKIVDQTRAYNEPMDGARRKLRWRAFSLGTTVLVLAGLFYIARYITEDQASGSPQDSSTITGTRGAIETDRQLGTPGSPRVGDSDERGVSASGQASEPIPGALWQVVDEASVAELPPYKEVVEGRVLIRVTGAADGWRVGQRITIPIPQIDETYTPAIERIEPGFSEARSYIGTLATTDGFTHRFTITVGPRNTFAHLSTPYGSYELVATGELGWLMPTVNMDQHVDYSVPDFVVLEGPESLQP